MWVWGHLEMGSPGQGVTGDGVTGHGVTWTKGHLDKGSLGTVPPHGGVTRAVPARQDVGLLELFKADQDTATPFTFYKTFGGSTHTFEAAAFPGRFLSTAPGPGQELALAPAPNATAFYLHRR